MRYDLSSSLIDPISLLQFGLNPHDIADIVLTYGPFSGRPSLCKLLADHYSEELGRDVTPESIMCAPGASGANFTFLYSFLASGDHCIVHYPTFQPLFTAPISLGASVSLLKTDIENDWQIDVNELGNLVRPQTKLIILNNPQNPTGQPITPETMREIVALARTHDLFVMCDEVFRPLSYNGEPIPSILSYGYKRVCATGSLSKAYSCAGLRLGWMITEDREVLEQFVKGRDIMTITVSPIIEALGERVLHEPMGSKLLGRNNEIVSSNLQRLTKFLARHKGIVRWIPPKAASMAFIQFFRNGAPIDDLYMCKTLREDIGLILVPASICYGKEYAGFVRLALGPKPEVLSKALEVLEDWLERNFAQLPTAAGEML